MGVLMVKKPGIRRIGLITAMAICLTISGCVEEEDINTGIVIEKIPDDAIKSPDALTEDQSGMSQAITDDNLADDYQTDAEMQGKDSSIGVPQYEGTYVESLAGRGTITIKKESSDRYGVEISWLVILVNLALGLVLMLLASQPYTDRRAGAK